MKGYPLPSKGPRYYILFDLKPSRPINGLKHKSLNNFSLHDETIQGKVYELAKAVWHLKDRINQWHRFQSIKLDVNHTTNNCKELLICSDLANHKKHGRNPNKSGLNPYVGLVNFDLSNNGNTEIYYDGAAKQKEVLVEFNAPVPYTINLNKLDDDTIIDSATTVIMTGFKQWIPILNRIFKNAQDRESIYVKSQINELFNIPR